MVSRRAFFAILPLPFLLKLKPLQCPQCGHQHMFPNYCGKDVWKAQNGLSMICECDIRKLGHHWIGRENPTLPADYKRRLLLSEERRRELERSQARELFERDEPFYRGVQWR